VRPLRARYNEEERRRFDLFILREREVGLIAADSRKQIVDSKQQMTDSRQHIAEKQKANSKQKRNRGWTFSSSDEESSEEPESEVSAIGTE
jgi:uncharacterized protein with WD repeat